MVEFISHSKKQHKANLHCHSTLSDGHLTPQQLKEAYKSRGYSILAITDHEVPYDHSSMNESDFLMLTAYEAYIRYSPKSNPFLSEVHLNLFARDPGNLKMVCYNHDYCKYLTDQQQAALEKVGSTEPRRYQHDYVQRFIDTAVENGYLVSYNHPCWSMEDINDILTYDNCFSMEMCNYSAFLLNRYEHNEMIYDMMLRRGKRIYCHGSDDNHNARPLDDFLSDSFGSFTMVYPERFDYPSVIKALEKGDFYASMGPRINQLWVDGKTKTAHLEAEGGVQLIMHFGSKSPRSVWRKDGGEVTSGDFIIPDEARYLRFTVVDEKGRTADTRGYFRDEWDF